MKTIILRALLWVVIAASTYYLIDLVYEDIHFANEKVRIETVRVRRLEKIRELMFAYKDENKKYPTKWEELIQFGKTGNFTIVKTIGDPNDTNIQVVRDTTFKPVVDSLFAGKRNDVDSIKYVPLSKDKAIFSLKSGRINLRNVYVDVFEIQDTDPFDKESDPLTLGSMNSASYDLNREYKKAD